MAPEYFRGGTLGPWTDVYAFGATLYRVIAGSFPRTRHLAEGTHSALRRDWEPAPLPPSQVCASLPKDLERVILKCLALEPRSRFASGGELFKALRQIEEQGPSRRNPRCAAPSTFEREAELARAETFLKGFAAKQAGSLRRSLVARSQAMQRLLAMIDRLRSIDAPLLIQGETGSGKETLARVLHEESRRRAGPFLVLDCATLPGPLLESELFGAKQGAFTDLVEDRPGILSVAEGGTVLVEEVGGATLEVQAKLLRVMGQGTYRRLGDETETRMNIRFLFSTSRDLEKEVKEGRFRLDLLHRIRVVTLTVPPLRERPEDISGLVHSFLVEDGGPVPVIDPALIKRLQGLPWPGNVRELRNLVLRLRLENSRRISVEELERVTADPRTQTIFPKNLLLEEPFSALKDRLERDYICYHFRRLRGDTTALSRFLRLNRQQFYRRSRRLGIRLQDERKRCL